MKTIAFFNNKGGVGKTSLVYHVGFMLSDLGFPTLAVDLDPQANLTAMFLDDSRLESLWLGDGGTTIAGAIEPLRTRLGDIRPATIIPVQGDGGNARLGILPGDLALSGFEDLLSREWPNALDRQEGAFRVLSAFHRVIVQGREQLNAQIVLLDVGPNLGSINRAALLAADYVILPLAPDLFSIQGLKNLGPTLREWRSGWQERLQKRPAGLDIILPSGQMEPLGYVIMQHGIRDSRPVKAYQRWMDRIPKTFRSAVKNEDAADLPNMESDPYKLALIKHYRSLMPLAMEAHKPMFYLKPADGAIGGHQEAVQLCRKNFEDLCHTIMAKLDLRRSPEQAPLLRRA